MPDSSCATESQFKSITGTTHAVLQIINNSDETVKAYWLDYTGKRVFYVDIKPHTSYLQATWLTHPWVITSSAGACYRFLVMNSQEQSVTVEPVLGPGETVAPLATANPSDRARTERDRPTRDGRGGERGRAATNDCPVGRGHRRVRRRAPVPARRSRSQVWRPRSWHSPPSSSSPARCPGLPKRPRS